MMVQCLRLIWQILCGICLNIDLCRKINESERFGKPAIIIITALENEEVEAKVKELGVKSFMKKPLDLVKIVETVNNILSENEES